MPTYYIDPSGGSDTNTGTSWATAWKTINAGTSTAIAPGDSILIAESPSPTLIGTGTWTSVPVSSYSSLSIVSTTNAAPIVVTVTAHGYSTGDCIYIQNHTTNLTANGTWLVTSVNANQIILDGSAGVGAGGAAGNSTKIPWHCVVITATTLTIDRCEQAWQTGPNCTVTADTSQYKEGDASLKIVNSAIITGSQLMAYFTISATNFSPYQQISFWLYNNQAIATAGNLTVTLCSGTNGTVAVDTFSIPVVPSTSRWLPLTIDKGSALGSDIRSVAVNCSGRLAARTLYFDNFIACKATTSTTSLSLQSLISKNTLSKGTATETNYGSECWYGIQSISEDGKIVRLDGDTNRLPSADIITKGAGYSTSGTSPENVNTYKRETFKTSLGESSSVTIQEIQDDGTTDSLISCKGGYNTGTNEQTGETFFDGLNGNGYGLYLNGKTCNFIDNLNFLRYYNGLNFSSSSGSNNTVQYVKASNSANYGISISSAGTNIFDNISSTNNNGYGVGCGNIAIIRTILNCSNNYNSGLGILGPNVNVEKIVNSNNNSQFGVLFNNYNSKIYYIVNCSYNKQYGVYFGNSNNYIFGITTTGNTLGAFSSIGVNYVRNAIIGDTTEFVGATAYANSRIYSEKHDGQANNHYIYTDNGVIQSDATNTASAASVIAWKLSPTSIKRDINYPLNLSLAKIACVSGTQVTVTAQYKVSNTTDIKGTLICKGDQIANVASDVSVTTSNADTNYETLTIQFTPGEAGVVEIEGNAFWVANAADESVYIDDMTINQA